MWRRERETLPFTVCRARQKKVEKIIVIIVLATFYFKLNLPQKCWVLWRKNINPRIYFESGGKSF